MITIVRKLPNYDKEDLADLRRIQAIMATRGYKINLKVANAIWRDYSDMCAATFLRLGRDDDFIAAKIIEYGTVEKPPV